MRHPLTFLAAVILLLGSIDLHAQRDFFDRTDDLLKKYVSQDGQVNYSALSEARGALDDILYDIQHTALAGRSGEYRYAFYLNTYNILVIANIVDHWPVSNPLDIPGFFDEITFMVAGEKLTLNEIEHQKLLAEYDDPRIHFVLVCAGKGCPPLRPHALLPSELDNMLEERTREAINTPLMVLLKQADKKVLLSSIFDWYADDFGKDTAGVIRYINKYRVPPVPEYYKVEYQEYDWNVNGY